MSFEQDIKKALQSTGPFVPKAQSMFDYAAKEHERQFRAAQPFMQAAQAGDTAKLTTIMDGLLGDLVKAKAITKDEHASLLDTFKAVMGLKGASVAHAEHQHIQALAVKAGSGAAASPIAAAIAGVAHNSTGLAGPGGKAGSGPVAMGIGADMVGAALGALAGALIHPIVAVVLASGAAGVASAAFR